MPARAKCPWVSPAGRKVTIHRDERLLKPLRQRRLTPAGRNGMNVRPGEHDRAHIGRWQRPRARYSGQRKNRFYLRRSAVVQNLHIPEPRRPPGQGSMIT